MSARGPTRITRRQAELTAAIVGAELDVAEEAFAAACLKAGNAIIAGEQESRSYWRSVARSIEAHIADLENIIHTVRVQAERNVRVQGEKRRKSLRSQKRKAKWKQEALPHVELSGVGRGEGDFT